MARGGRRTVSRTSGGKVECSGFRIPAEADTVTALLNARTVEEVREAHHKSAWMAKQPYSYLTRYLPELAEQFLKAKCARRYPKSDRPSSIQKKFWFLACALAGAMHGLSARRAVNIVGPGKPGEIFDALTPATKIIHTESNLRSRSKNRSKVNFRNTTC